MELYLFTYLKKTFGVTIFIKGKKQFGGMGVLNSVANIFIMTDKLTSILITIFYPI